MLRPHRSTATETLSLQSYNLLLRSYKHDLIRHIRPPWMCLRNSPMTLVVELSLKMLPVCADLLKVNCLLHHISLMWFRCVEISVVSPNHLHNVHQSIVPMKQGFIVIADCLFRIRMRCTSVVLLLDFFNQTLVPRRKLQYGKNVTMEARLHHILP